MPDFRVYYDDGDYNGVSKVLAIDTSRCADTTISRFLVWNSYVNKFMWVDTKYCMPEEDKKVDCE